MSWPRKRIVPDVGLSSPVMQLTNVVLPAPFGPMTPRISPLRIVRSTPPTAARPPNRFVSWRTSSSGVPSSPGNGKRETGNDSFGLPSVSVIFGSSFSVFRFPFSGLIEPARPDIGEQDVGTEASAASDGGEPAEELHQAAREEDDEEDDDQAEHR